MMKTSLLALATLAVCSTSALAEKRVGTKMTLPAKTAAAPVAAVAKAAKVAPIVAVSTAVAANDIATLDISDAPVELGDLTGGEFDVFTRKHETAQAGDKEPTLKIKGGDEKQQSAVAKTKIADVEYCWDRLPAARRTGSTAVLKLSIEPIGSVAKSEIAGEALHAEFKKCVADAASRWRFPVTDAATEIEFAVSLSTIAVAH